MTIDGRAVRVGVDIGGTFTDVALEAGDRSWSVKVLTDHGAPERAIVEGVRAVVAESGIAAGAIDQIIHGTTLATNALIERRGARTALITTRGFRDVVEMRTENRFELYDLDIVLPTPLVERDARFVVDERLDAAGRVLKPLDPADVATVVDRVIAGGFESVAIGLIHAHVDGRHERMVRDALKAKAPDLPVSISSEVAPEMREFQRFNTVCANAYVQPLIASYLDRLVGALAAEGVTGRVYMIHSGGGLITVESAAAFPVRLLESGPAGGAVFAGSIARAHGLDRVLSFDMGGTTAKIALIENGRAKTAKTFEVARTYRFKKGSGMPISIPVIEMVEIGAGGGSIASIDAMRRIRVGPQSAGSEPGPASYGRGGDRPTVTDADVLLGRIEPHGFAGGRMRLDTEAAEAAILRDLGGPLGLSGAEAAFGLCEVVDENMSNAARMHVVENGREISDFTMVAFGGAGPLHAARLAEKLGIARVLIPPGAGVGSAIGFLRAPFGYESVRSAHLRLDAFDADRMNAVLDELAAEAIGFVREGVPDIEPIRELTAHMRYVGQGWEIPVRLPDRRWRPGDEVELARRFAEAYTAFFHRPIEGLAIEVVGWSLAAASPLPPVERVAPAGTERPVATDATRDLFDAREDRFVTAAVIERERLSTGDRVAGPAAIVEAETTTVVTTAFDAVRLADGCLLLVRKTAGGRP
jgi:N-methylhydantoinase A